MSMSKIDFARAREGARAIRLLASLTLLASLGLVGCAAETDPEPTATNENALTARVAAGEALDVPEERLVNGHAIDDRFLAGRAVSGLGVEEGAAAARYRAPLVNKEDSIVDARLRVPEPEAVNVGETPVAHVNPMQGDGLADRLANAREGEISIVTFGGVLVPRNALVAEEMEPRFGATR